MKGPAREVFILVVSIAVMLIGGCAGQEPPSVKKSRTIAAENIELRKELAQSSKEIEKLKEQHSKEIDEQKKLLQTCRQEKEAWKKKSRQNIRSQVKGVLDTVLEENKKLREENNKLKAQIEELQQ